MKEWQEGNKPVKKGFYAIHYSWCINEGSFMSNDYFNGKEWAVRDNPTSHFAGPFKTPNEADEFCDNNDITW